MAARFLPFLILMAPVFVRASADTPSIPLLFVEHSAAPARYGAASPGSNVEFTVGSVKWGSGPAALELRFAGRRSQVDLAGSRLSSARIHYLHGSASSGWRTDLPVYGSVVYRGLYSGIDAEYRADGSLLKAEFTLAPGANPEDIRMEFSAPIGLGNAGGLQVYGASAKLVENAPLIYQDTPSGRVTIDGAFQKLGPQTAGFRVGPYDRSLPLVIDPTITYSTYLGGTGMGAVTGVAADSAGNLYVAGWTEAQNFPIVLPTQAASGGGVDVFVAKLNPAGNTLIYATYFGGRGDDRAAGVAVDSSGQVRVAGSTNSTNFPLSSAVRSSLGGAKDAFVTALNANGNGVLFSTYLGGTDIDQATAVAVDAAGNTYVAGDEQSLNFPTLNPLQSGNAGAMDAFLAKLDPAGTLLYSTYLGGAAAEHAGAVAVDAAGNMFVVGGTYSANYPRINAVQSNIGGSQDAFVTKISANGTQMIFSTLLGGSGQFTPEQANGVAIDVNGNAYVVGVTNSTNFPVTAGVYQNNFGGVSDAFAARLAPNGALNFCTYVGGADFDWANAVALDPSGKAHLAGYTSSHNFPSVGGTQAGLAGLYDSFVARLSAAGNSIDFATYYGGSKSDVANSIAVDSNGNMFLGGQTSSFDFPLAGAIQSVNNGGSVGWLARIGVTAPPAQTPSVNTLSPASGSGNTATFTATFGDTGGAAQLRSVSLLVNTTASASFACSISYNPQSGSFALAKDNPAEGSLTVFPGGGSETNSQCQLNGVGTSASLTANLLTITVSMVFQPAYEGSKTVYLAASDTGSNTGFVAKGTWNVTVPPAQPSADSVSPNASSGSGATFTFVFSDTQIANNITGMAMLFATSISPFNSCYMVFDRKGGTFSLLWDSGFGADVRPIAGTNLLQNSQCAVGAASARVSGLSQILTVSITFKGPFSGAKNIYMSATSAGLSTGWVQRGSYTVTAGGAPSAESAVPSTGSGPNQRFSFTISDPGGSSYLTGMAVLIASSFNTVGACSLVFDRPNNKISLGYDNPANGASPLTPGQNVIVSNSQCQLRGANSTVVIGTNSVVVTMDLNFSASWSGQKTIFLYAAEPNVNSGWRAVGTWQVTGGAPTADAVSPNAGSGSSPSFTFTVSDSVSQANISAIAMLFTTGAPTNLANACYLVYDRNTSTINLYNDAASALSNKGVGASGTLQNSQCAVGYTVMNLGGTSVNFTINLLFKPAFQGNKTVYLQALEPAATSGWVQRGTWTVP